MKKLFPHILLSIQIDIESFGEVVQKEVHRDIKNFPGMAILKLPVEN